MTVIMGFTGTQRGMTPQQRTAVTHLLHRAGVIHLGDCLGADADAHAIAARLGVLTVGHPPDNPKARAFLTYLQQERPKPYLVRNRDIVDAGVHGLIATPATAVPPGSLRGQGTWSTVRYACLVGRPVFLVLPNGTVENAKAAAHKLGLSLPTA